jgi:hypothetical protein
MRRYISPRHRNAVTWLLFGSKRLIIILIIMLWGGSQFRWPIIFLGFRHLQRANQIYPALVLAYSLQNVLKSGQKCLKMYFLSFYKIKNKYTCTYVSYKEKKSVGDEHEGQSLNHWIWSLSCIILLRLWLRFHHMMGVVPSGTSSETLHETLKNYTRCLKGTISWDVCETMPFTFNLGMPTLFTFLKSFFRKLWYFMWCCLLCKIS